MKKPVNLVWGICSGNHTPCAIGPDHVLPDFGYWCGDEVRDCLRSKRTEIGAIIAEVWMEAWQKAHGYFSGPQPKAQGWVSQGTFPARVWAERVLAILGATSADTEGEGGSDGASRVGSE